MLLQVITVALCLFILTSAQSAPSQNVSSQILSQRSAAPTKYTPEMLKKVHHFDPCFSSPCRLREICRSFPDRSFVCQAELQFPNDIARSLVNPPSVPNPAIRQNNIRLSEVDLFFTNLKKIVGKNKDVFAPPALISPPEPIKGSQLEKVNTVSQNATITQLKFRNQNTLMDKIETICLSHESGDRLAMPSNPHQFIACMEGGDFMIMDCPDDLVFNVNLDRCDFSEVPTESGCASTPCQANGKCTDLPNKEYQCECPDGYSGVNCEKSPDFCAANPCGASGVCHLMPPNSPIPFFCTCLSGETYGLDCARTFRNPCIDDSLEELHATSIDSRLYVHCDSDVIHLRFCHDNLIFSPETKICDWVDESLRMPANGTANAV